MGPVLRREFLLFAGSVALASLRADEVKSRLSLLRSINSVIASAAKQSIDENWIASSLRSSQ